MSYPYPQSREEAFEAWMRDNGFADVVERKAEDVDMPRLHLAASRYKLEKLIEAAEGVYQNRDEIFDDPNAVHRRIKKMGRVLNEVRGLR